MANYFNLILDTTGPNIEISALSYTVKGLDYDISVTSTEPLDDGYQDFCIVDAQGNNHKIILTITADGLSYAGTINFSNCAVGIAKIVAQVRDEVGNLSNVATFAVNVMSQQYYYCDMAVQDGQGLIKITDGHADFGILSGSLGLEISEQAAVIACDSPCASLSIERVM